MNETYEFIPGQENVWYRRWLVYAARFAFRVKKLLYRLVMFAIFALTCYFAASYALASADTPQLSIAQAKPGFEDLYNEFEHMVYRWHDDVTDATVSPSLLAARQALGDNKQLVIVAATQDDAKPATPMPCSALWTTGGKQREYIDLLADAETFLRATAHTVPRCVCAPMLGRSLIYMAVSNGSNSSRAHVHVLEPEDVHAAQYEALNAEYFDKIGVDLVITNESQDYRYNQPRGVYSLIRRQQVNINMRDKACNREKLTVQGDLAICVQECFDMMLGIDVRERARRQYQQGVVLNKAVFDNVKIVIKKSELKDEL